MSDKNVICAEKNPLCTNIVFVDGLGRAAKSLMMRIISYMERADHWQYPLAIENMCYMVFVGAVSENAARTFVQFEGSYAAYTRIIGRDLNMRAGDTSSILMSPDPHMYIQRSTMPAHMAAVDKYLDEGRFPVFQLHNGMATGRFIFDAFPESKLIHICRHPIDQAYKHYERGWGAREAEDPLSSVITVDTPFGIVPWFAHDWAESFVSGNDMERALDSVLYLQEADEIGIAALSESQRKRLYRANLERTATQPDTIVDEVASFIESAPRPDIKAMLLNEGVPRVLNPDSRKRMFDELAANCAAEKIERLLQASSAYETLWEIEPFAP